MEIELSKPDMWNRMMPQLYSLTLNGDFEVQSYLGGCQYHVGDLKPGPTHLK